MSLSEIKLMYESLLESGDLFSLFPNMTGDWVKDQKDFTTQYDFNLDILNDADFTIDDYEDY